MTRPSELEEFFQRHGKPLEVGMVVYVYKAQWFEYLVNMIEANGEKIGIRLEYLSGKNKGYFVNKIFSPLDLTPIL